MKKAGVCKRTDLLRKKGSVDHKKSGERQLLVEHMTDLKHAYDATEGCCDYVRVMEGRDSLSAFPGGAKTRWKYWIDVAAWLDPSGESCCVRDTQQAILLCLHAHHRSHLA